MSLEAPRARYQQVADDLRAAIKRGEYPAGSLLPSQPELARRYGLNQTSINRAITVLRAEGLVRVEHGRGAFVQEVPTVKRVRRVGEGYRGDPGGSPAAGEPGGARPSPQADEAEVEVVIPPAEIAGALHLSEAEQALMRRRRMHDGDAPVQIATSYIPMTAAGSPDIAFPDTGPSGIDARLAEHGFGPVRFTEDIEVRPPTRDEARILRIPEGQPVFEVLRTAFDARDRPVEACATVLPALHWRLSYSWRQGA